MKPCELTLFITILANYVAKDLSDDDLVYMSAVLSLFVDTLSTIVVQRERNAAKKNVSEDDQLDTLAVQTDTNLNPVMLR
ncbi:hypothetical protein [Sinanaerobacter chloroacetimidivorans]|uniref:Uncharacterized protein n=1 Tax=Sinanaerobacter chloroacetimidivorans TaxID=2818044 RepID=A0A8J7W4F4_9FIRM|nr:hypothetical protein [Sinanaerobacter chloroacetimidivorans]MBR0599158.1 hypothetical protein [Sinanaerobacter chloroacetimidivorans]